MMTPEITVRPEKRYAGGRLKRGARRNNGAWGRTLALFDSLDIRKRPNTLPVRLSAGGLEELTARATSLRVRASGLAAFLIESGLRGLRGGKRTHCRVGHELTPANTITTKSSGKRQCRECRRAADRFRKRKARAKRRDSNG